MARPTLYEQTGDAPTQKVITAEDVTYEMRDDSWQGPFSADDDISENDSLERVGNLTQEQFEMVKDLSENSN